MHARAGATIWSRCVLLVGVVLALVVAGCRSGPIYQVRVNGLGNTTPDAYSTFIVIPAMEGITADDLQFAEYAQYVVTALKDRGFKPVSESDTADLAVALSYGISDPQSQAYSYSVPTYGVTGYQSSTTTGVAVPVGGSTYYTGKTTYTPTYGVTGSQTYSGVQTYFTRYCVIGGYDLEALRSSGDVKQVWKTVITSSGSSGDLRRALPAMIAAAQPLIATNTGVIREVDIKESDERVRRIKGATE